MLRRRLPSDLERPLEAFREVVAVLEPAKEGLTDVLPTTRLPGASLPGALVALEAALDRVSALMPRWRHPAMEDAWLACDAGVAEAQERVRLLREEAPDPSGFEGLIGAVEHLLEPLDAFRSAADAFRDLRRRRP